MSTVWLSDPEVKHLTMTPDIDRETQRIWFESLPVRTDYFIRGIKVNAHPVGAVGIKHIDLVHGTGEYWGYLGDKQLFGCGIGKEMVWAMFLQAKKIGLSELTLNVADYNKRAYRLYQKAGFIEIGQKNHVVEMKVHL